MLFLLAGPDCSLYHQMVESYRTSVAPGTLANRIRQAKSYLKFAVLYDVPYLHPNETQICMYAQYLKNRNESPRTVKNYISGAKTWILEHGGSIQAFLSKELDQLTKGFVKNSDHVPHRAFPLSVSHLLLISDFVHFNTYVPRSIMACIVIGYKCFLRASNLLSPSSQVWGGPHTLLTRDITVLGNKLLVSISSTKTKWDNQPETFVLLSESDTRLCPVTLWTQYASVIKPYFLGPAFLTDDYMPLTARHVVGVMRAALADAKDLDPGRVSLHSLRRGAVQDAVDKGIPLPQIKTLGLWKSDSGVSPYLRNPPRIFQH